jgi:uncharacterized oligopeptide transporter (OPT) family protein
MAFVLGLAGPVPALGLLGVARPWWAIALWGLAAGVLGIATAIVLRRKLIVDDGLPFPTGRATGEVFADDPRRARGGHAAGRAAAGRGGRRRRRHVAS